MRTLVVLFAAAPFAGQACGSSVRAIAERIERAQQSSRLQVPAVLLMPASSGFGPDAPEVLAQLAAVLGVAGLAIALRSPAR